MKLEEGMDQAVTQVKVSSPVIINVAEADGFHCHGRLQYKSCYRQGTGISVGVLGHGMIQDGIDVNLGDPLSSSPEVGVEYVETSRKGQGLTDDLAEVGLVDSTRSLGKPSTGGSGQPCCVCWNSSLSDPRRFG